MSFNPDNQQPNNHQEVLGCIYFEGEYISEEDLNLINTCTNVSESESIGQAGVNTIAKLLLEIQCISLSSYFTKRVYSRYNPENVESISPTITKLVHDIFAMMYLKYPNYVKHIINSQIKMRSN